MLKEFVHNIAIANWNEWYFYVPSMVILIAITGYTIWLGRNRGCITLADVAFMVFVMILSFVPAINIGTAMAVLLVGWLYIFIWIIDLLIAFSTGMGKKVLFRFREEE